MTPGGPSTEQPEPPATVTPRDLARRFGVTQLTVRNHLRDLYGTLPEDTTRWLLDPEQEAAVIARLTGQTGRARRTTHTEKGVLPRAWTPPECSDLEVDLPPEPAARVVTRVEFALQADFGRWLTEQDTPPSLLPLPTDAGTLHPDFYVHGRQWLVEAKKSSERQCVRMAIGQVLDYCHLAATAGIGAQPVVLLPQRPADDLVELIHSLGITLVHREHGTFTVAGPLSQPRRRECPRDVEPEVGTISPLLFALNRVTPRAAHGSVIYCEPRLPDDGSRMECGRGGGRRSRGGHDPRNIRHRWLLLR